MEANKKYLLNGLLANNKLSKSTHTFRPVAHRINNLAQFCSENIETQRNKSITIQIARKNLVILKANCQLTGKGPLSLNTKLSIKSSIDHVITLPNKKPAASIIGKGLWIFEIFTKIIIIRTEHAGNKMSIMIL